MNLTTLLNGAVALNEKDIFTIATLNRHPSSEMLPLGTIGITSDGRLFRFCKVGAADLVPGNVVQGPATVPNHLALTPVAGQAVGDTTVNPTLGATLASANQYAEGWMGVDTTPGNGRVYGIATSPAIAQSAAGVFGLRKDDPFAALISTASRIGFMANPWNGVIQFPVTTATGIVAGVAVHPITAGNFGWVQTRGMCSVLINGTPALGASVVTPSGTAAGAVDVETAVNALVAQRIGNMAQIGVSGKNNFVYLRID